MPRAESTPPGGPAIAKGDTQRIASTAPVTDVWHKPVFIGFLLVWAANLVIAGFGVALPLDGLWVEGLLPVTAAATTLIGLRRVLPWQNILAMAAIIGGSGYAVMMVCVRSGLPFGPLTYLDAEANPMFGVVPWWVPALWVVLIVNARGVARLMLYRWRTNRNYGLWVIVVTCLLVAGFDVGLEPFATRSKHYWVWSADKAALSWTWFGAPVTSFLGWTISTFLVTAGTIVWAINKRPAPVAPHYHPLAVWAMLGAMTIVGNLASELWLPAACSAVFIVTTGSFCFLPARRTAEGFRSPAFPSGAVRGRQTRG